MPDRWRLGTRNPFTVYRVADGAHDVEHGGYFLGSFRREEDARRAVDAVNGAPSVDEMAHVIDEAFDADFESRMSGGGSVSREDMARDAAERVTDLWPAQSTTPPSCDCPDTDGAEPAGSAVGQRGAPTRDVLVAQFDDALFYNGPDGASVFRWLDGRSTPADEPMLAGLAERMADVALAALRDGGADTGGEDEGAGHWTKEEVKRARERMATVPPHARPMWTPGSFGDRSRGATARPPSRCANCGRDLEDVCAAVAGGGLACSAGCADAAAVVNTLRRLNAEPAEDESPAEAVYEAVQWARKGKRDAQAAIDRLARALGVSLDPDDPDPVGRLVEAAGKAREVEVVSGAEAAKLPMQSLAVWCAPDGTPNKDEDPFLTYLISPSEHDLRARVLYRAPAPAPAAPAVGEVVTGQRAVDAPVGTTLGRTDQGGAAWRTAERWWAAGLGPQESDQEAVRSNRWVVLDLGGDA